MADSHTGAFGATAVALVAVLEVAALGSLLRVPPVRRSSWYPLFARFAATAAAWLGTPARPGGLGRLGHGTALVSSRLPCARLTARAAATCPCGVATVPKASASALAISGSALALVVPHVLALRFGGVTGDVMGASVLLTEALAVRRDRAGGSSHG